MNKKADIDVVRRQNRFMILQALRLRGPMPRVDLGRVTQLSPATVTTITAQLMVEDLIMEQQVDHGAHTARGRPTVALQLNPLTLKVLALKISIDRFELILSDYSGHRVAEDVLALSTFKMSPAEIVDKASAFILHFLAQHGLESRQVKKLGIAVQGAADANTGELSWSPAFQVRNITLVEPISAQTGIDCVLANDANMIAEGLMARELNLYRGTAAVVFLGYGVGMGLVINGTVFHGATGAAAEFGHMNHIPLGALCRCGRLGCLEAYASDYGILRHAEKLPLDIPPPYAAVDRSVMLALEDAARRGDQNAVAAYQNAGRALGYGLARVIALLNPDRIVISGPGLHAFALMENALNQALEEGVVEALRQNITIEKLPLNTDMILTGTINKILGELDLEYKGR